MQQIMTLVDTVCGFTALISMIFSVHDFLSLLFYIRYYISPSHNTDYYFQIFILTEDCCQIIVSLSSI
jgi:hypothetical protein